MDAPPDGPRIIDATITRFSPDRGYTGRYRSHFHELTGSAVSGRVLDVGAGGGGTHDHWDFPNTTEVVRMDIDQYDNLDVRADGTNLPFAAKTFDSVICSAVFEHVSLSRLHLLFEEIQRVLKPGGKLFGAVAFNYPLHGQPHDYSRPSIHGLNDLAVAAGLDVDTLYRGGSYVDTLLHVLFSPVRRTCMFLGVRWLSGAFALVHYPFVALAWLIALGLKAGYGENPFGSHWNVQSAIVAQRPE
ncbi:class I SAM-dependent methyltransferase [Halorubellus litoreus]|uniref:Class I SAM-dependent methyltransferase n=1 Tax=Halorubellus litoreus TaxID=755308 RepID=A0ABD5VCX8_9EURY